MRRPPAVARVLERVTRTAREHEMFAKGDTVLVSVSGGPDSVCLLYSLWYLRRLFAIRLQVFHFDHRLRAGSAKDAAYVARLAERLKLPFHLRSTDDGPRKGESVEAWATVERMDAVNEVRTVVGAEVIAEGHTLDDQAETVLLNLIRGGGLEAISGIWPGARTDAIVQPLIDVEERLGETGVSMLAATRPDAAHRLQPAASDQVHQDGLDLVVERVALGDRPGADRLAHLVRGVHARNGRPRLDGSALRGCVHSGSEMEGRSEAIGEPADVLGVLRGVGPQAMIEMEHLEPDRE